MNLTDLLLAITPLALLGVGAFLFFFGWLLGGGQSRLFYTVVIVTGLGAFLAQAALGIGYGRAGGIRTPEAELYTWSPVGDTGFGVTLGFRGDLLAYLFALPLAALSLIAVFYSMVRRPQAETQEGILPGRLYGLLFLAEGSGLAAFYSSDLVLTCFWLEGVGLALYLLSGPGLRGASARPVSFRAWCVNFSGGLLILISLLVMISRGGGRSDYNQLVPAVLDPTLFGLLLLGCLIKAAQFPFQGWLGSFEDLPGAAYGVIAGGFLFPFAIYLPVRLQSLAGDRIDLLTSLNWLLIPVGALTTLFATIVALRLVERSLPALVGLLSAAQFGFVLIALGLGQPAAALQQLSALVIGAPLLFLCADQLQIELTSPPNPDNRVNPTPLGRSPLLRPLLIGLYLVGAWNFAGLPLSPAYSGRWQTLSVLLSNGHKFWFALAGLGLILLIPALLRPLLSFLNGPRKTADARGQEWLWALVGPAALALLSLALGFQPALTGDWIANALVRVQPDAANLNNPAATGWLGLLMALGLVAALAVFLAGRRSAALLPYNGGLSFAPEDPHRPRYARTGRSKTALKVIEPEVEVPEGFEDEFFAVAFGRKPKPTQLNRRRLPDPRLSSRDYFGPLTERLTGLARLFDTSYDGSFFGTLLLRLMDWLRRVFEWLVERFYPALAAFILLVFIILLTR